ncbi:MAG TPA: RtcB family protein [Candidatus Bathyarchaeia archaeon]|nr:RtcB family protein [Candidatus Bathyarchaeia archaeon]
MAVGLKKIGLNKWQVERLPQMRAEVIVFAKEAMIPQLQEDLSLSQLQESAMLPQVISPVVGLPDIHQGFGLPIGGVMATEGLISVGAVGMDINCGVRLLVSNLEYHPRLFNQKTLQTLIRKIEREIPIGLGGKRQGRIPGLTLNEVVVRGAEALVRKGFGVRNDLESIEEGGKLEGASFEALTDRAKKRGEKQVGTLGSGNHFIEIQKIEKVFDPQLAKAWGLFENQIGVMIHCGSRGLGHQTCLDYTDLFWRLKEKYRISVPRKGLAALPLETPEGTAYFGAMAAAVNFAFANRQFIEYQIQGVFNRFFKNKARLKIVYDVAHNIAKWEPLGGKQALIHRKGATRALPAGHSKNPKRYKKTGHPAIIPGSMGTSSFVLVGLPGASETYFSVNHGAGRAMSRREAKEKISQEEFEKQMGEIVYNKPFQVIADEAPGAYKDINLVIDTLVESKIAKKVVQLTPLAVIKGS